MQCSQCLAVLQLEGQQDGIKQTAAFVCASRRKVAVSLLRVPLRMDSRSRSSLEVHDMQRSSPLPHLRRSQQVRTPSILL